MKTLILPANGRYGDVLEMVSGCDIEIKVIRDATIEHPELVDENNNQYIGKEAIIRELEEISGCTSKSYLTGGAPLFSEQDRV
jgi:hypothetical protein